MPRYDKYGPQDDVTLEDLDLGFIGFNNRLRPDQLPAGMLAECNNARLDRTGSWELRNGVDSVGAPIAVGADALTLPFTLLADDNTVTITIDGNDDLQIADYDNIASLPTTGSILISGLTGVTPDPTTAPQVYSKSGSNLIVAGTFSGTPAGTEVVKFPVLNDDAINRVYGSCSFSDPNSAENESYIIIATNAKAVAYKVSDPDTTFDLAYPSATTISDTVDMIQAFNKVFIFRKGEVALEVDLATNNITSSPAMSLVSSGVYSQPVQIVCASGEFALIENRGIVHQSDSVSVGDQVSVVGDKTLSADNSSGLTIGELFNVNKVFTGGSTQSIDSATSASVTGGEYDGLYKVTCSLTAHGYNVGDPIDITGFTGGQAAANGSRYVAEVSDADTFVFYMDGNPNMSSTTGGSVALSHGFEFFVDSSKTSAHVTDGASLTSTPVFTKRVSQGLGFIHMPTPEFGVLHQRRLVVPYQFDPEDSNASRKIFDEVIASDILDSDTYDGIFGSFRFNAGASDFTVGIVSFTEDSILIFNKNSIYRVSGTVDPQNATTQLLTNEIGALARKSIVQVGRNVFFLSDNGVYSLEFLDEYNLRGTQTPLSEPIQSTIEQIDPRFAKNSVAVYFNNRYYIAVPLKTNPDGSSNDDGINNAILVYNFLNNQWESIDTVNSSPAFEYTNLLVAGLGLARGVYSVNVNGGIHLVDADVEDFSTSSRSGFDNVITAVGDSNSAAIKIDGKLKTRMYTYNDIGRKKYNSFDIQAEGNTIVPTDFSIKIETENIDTDLGTQKSLLGNASKYLGNAPIAPSTPPEDVAIRGRIGNMRAYGAQLQIENVEGRPKIRNIKTAATQTFKSTNPAT
jgi:hypothetical protein